MYINRISDKNDLEVACVICLNDGRYGLIEIKLGNSEIEKEFEMNNNRNITRFLFIALAVFILFNKNYIFASGDEEHVTKYNNLFYYYKNGLPYKALPNSFKRINDTYYFVNDEGVICDKTNYHYPICTNPELNTLINKPLNYESVKNFVNSNRDSRNQARIYKNAKLTLASDGYGFYVGTTTAEKYEDVFIVGDSYAYLMKLYTNDHFRYAAKPTYSLYEIKNEILELIDWNGTKYVVLAIGPNDMMINSTLSEFRDNLNYILTYIKGNGATPVMMTYLDAYDKKYDYSSESYDAVVQELLDEVEGIYVDVKDIDIMLGRGYLFDLVHPSPFFYRTALDRIVEAIRE